jgi:hypothetical protein
LKAVVKRSWFRKVAERSSLLSFWTPPVLAAKNTEPPVVGDRAPSARPLSASEGAAGRSAFLEDDQVSAGCFSLLGLGDVREALGPRWPSMKIKVHAIAEASLDRHLSRGDVYDQQDEQTYVVLFARLSQAEAQSRCGVIRKDICRRLLGEGAGSASRIETTVTRMPRVLLTAEDRKDRIRVQLERLSSASPASVKATPQISVSYRNPAASKDAGHAWTSVNWRSSRAGQHRGPSTPRVPAPQEPVWRYEPVWDGRERRLIRFRLLDRSEGRPSLKSDILALRRGAEDVLRLRTSGHRFEVVCPLRHAALFEPDGAAAYLARVRALPRELRTLLTVELTGVRDQAWTGRAVQMTEDLQAAGVRTWARTPLEAVDADTLAPRPPRGADRRALRPVPNPAGPCWRGFARRPEARSCSAA